jgi:N6-adenosine-specific RNA methylase IME4/ParB-like chromosome segregation protein Spo0J
MSAKYQVMPPLSAAEHAELKADIEARGVLVPVEYDETGEILDGHHRVAICAELGITEFPRVVRIGLSEAGKLTHARQLNLARRHLDREQKRELIAQQLRETPQLSNRLIARDLGCDDKTVAAVRDEMESSAEIPQLDRTIGADGRERTTTPERPSAYRYIDPTPAGQQAVVESAKEVRAGRTAEVVKRNDEIRRAAAAIPVPAGQYRTVVIDPPWPMEIIDRDVRPGQAGMHYPVMTLEEIAEISLPVAEQSTVYLWTTQKFLPAAFEILRAWGLQYRFTMVWHKPGGPQPYNLPQYNCEFILVATRGPLLFLDTKQFFTAFNAPRREHSRKPDEFYDLVRRISPAPRVDWFSREPREGFEQFGIEREKFG